jgi:hypothetical protein
MNDDEHKSFDEIADWIEENYPVDGDIGEPEKTIEVLPASEPVAVPEPVTEPEREPEPVH